MLILYRDIRSISPGYLTFRMSTFSSLVFLFLSRSHCWTSQTPTAQPTVRPHSSIRKTRESTRRGWRPSWSRAGWMSELLLLSALLSITHSSPSKYFSLSFLPHWEKKIKKKENTATISEELKCHTGGGQEQPNQNGHYLACQCILGKQERGNQSCICSLSLLLFYFFIAWCDISYC